MSFLSAGSKIGRFRIESVLGQGGMGVVYLANDPDIGRPVAIKTVRPETVGRDTAQELEARFVKEARLAGRLQHPNIVTVYDVGRTDDTCFIAMEYVEGRPLTRFLGAVDGLPLAVRVSIVHQVAEALGHAHERGVLHRDVKPANILVGADGRVKVTDFGIGKFTGASTSDLTRTGHMIGSPAYMSPEQIKGETLDGRSDLFSLGIVLYEILTGARPFPGESITTLVYQILHTEPRDPLEWKSDLPVASREVIARLLAKSPDKRPANAKEFIQELARIEKIQRESQMAARGLAPPAASAAPTSIAAARPPATTSGAPVAPPAPPPAPGPPKRSAMPAVLIVLAILAAGSWFLLRQRGGGAESAAAAPTPAAAAAAPIATAAPASAEAAPIAAAEPPPEPTTAPAAEAPTPAPAAAEPTARARPTRRPRATAAPVEVASGPAPAPAPAAPPPAAPSKPDRVDAEYRTRRAVRFTSSPDQARLYLDGRFIGIADDWDNRGGGKELEFPKPGTHYVRMELPGYRPVVLEIDVSPDADKDSPSIDEELDRRERVSYEHLPAPADRTTGEVEFAVEPDGATITEDGKELGPASSFGPASPLRLSGPAVHDLMVAASGYRPKLVRVLVAPNAGRDRAQVKVSLKKD